MFMIVIPEIFSWSEWKYSYHETPRRWWNGYFYSISRDFNQPMKRPDFPLLYNLWRLTQPLHWCCYLFQGYLLQNSASRVVNAQSEMMCAHDCALEDQFKCRSFNFISNANVKKNCELNSRVESSSHLLVSRDGASYFERIDEGKRYHYDKICHVIHINY